MAKEENDPLKTRFHYRTTKSVVKLLTSSKQGLTIAAPNINKSPFIHDRKKLTIAIKKASLKNTFQFLPLIMLN